MKNPLTNLAKQIYKNAADHGFHPDDSTVEFRLAALNNLHDEVSELHMSHRKGTWERMCDKPVPLSEAEEEMADIIIRALDDCIAFGFDPDHIVKVKMDYNKTRPFLHGDKKY